MVPIKVHKGTSRILGCKVEKFPMVYLGHLLGVKRNDQNIWQGALDRCVSRRTPWKKQHLSFGGRFTLVNSVLDGMSTYLMSLFSMPVNVEKRMNSLRSQFSWEGNVDKKRFHLVKWEVVLKDKKGGGLGVRNLKLHSKSLLLKWLWMYNLEGEEIWKKLVNVVYGKEDRWCTINGEVWKNISRLGRLQSIY